MLQIDLAFMGLSFFNLYVCFMVLHRHWLWKFTCLATYACIAVAFPVNDLQFLSSRRSLERERALLKDLRVWVHVVRWDGGGGGGVAYFFCSCISFLLSPSLHFSWREHILPPPNSSANICTRLLCKQTLCLCDVIVGRFSVPYWPRE